MFSRAPLLSLQHEKMSQGVEWDNLFFLTASKLLWMLFTNGRKEGEKVFPTPSPPPLCLLLLQNTQMKKWSKDEDELTLSTYEKDLGSPKTGGRMKSSFCQQLKWTTWRNYQQKSPCFVKSKISALVNYTIQLPQCKYRYYYFFNAVVLEDSWCPKHSSDLHLTSFSNQLI